MATNYVWRPESGKRLLFARKLRGLTKKALAETAGATPNHLARLEAGLAWPDAALFNRLTSVLGFPPAFFRGEELPAGDLAQTHFRANRRVPRNVRQAAFNYGRLVFSIFAYLENRGVNFPEPKTPSFPQPDDERDMEELALEARAEAGLGVGPIRDAALALENLGVKVILLPENPVRLDAFAAWINGAPCVLVDGGQAPGRMQFDFAHELSHLVFDRHNPPDDPLLERRANRFAGAFLMPAPSFGAECPRRYDPRAFIKIKERWRVSISAALYRGRQLGIISEKAYLAACVARQKAGTRINEEHEFEAPAPTLLDGALDLIAEHARLDKMAEDLALEPRELTAILRAQQVSEAVIAKMRGPLRQARIFDFASGVRRD